MTFPVKCAWTGETTVPNSHGICPPCKAAVLSSGRSSK